MILSKCLSQRTSLSYKLYSGNLSRYFKICSAGNTICPVAEKEQSPIFIMKSFKFLSKM